MYYRIKIRESNLHDFLKFTKTADARMSSVVTIYTRVLKFEQQKPCPVADIWVPCPGFMRNT